MTRASSSQDNRLPIARKYYMGVGAVVSRLHESHISATYSRVCEIKTYLSSEKIDFDKPPYLKIDMNSCFDNINAGSKFDNALIDGVGAKYDPQNSIAKIGIREGRDAGCHSTTLGLEWPSGQFAGQLFLESHFFNEHIGEILHSGHVWPPRDGRKPSWSAQYVQMRRNDGGRYIGFSARLAADASPRDPLRLKVWHPLLERETDLTLPWGHVDYDDDPYIAGFSMDPMPTETSKEGERVSAFIDIKYVVTPALWNHVLMTPKLPFWMG